MTKLAIDGGTSVRTMPFAPWPYFAADDIAAAGDVLCASRDKWMFRVVFINTVPDSDLFRREARHAVFPILSVKHQ
ncbi:hypothetical protein [Desulfallas thermosapovorans]|uniref:Uncharacterized protein n=1 Tax=Desulfallas thermosapovorans DSM 6562 TaxID=1121431 RepID=A0A5S4ZMN7_9FIRM|nr:hypothetical protein [Desulfallas thermosapovorans]TYO92288.1 hypothetical protein LX24_02917 [Desulfallas thermosapovorans DSM 6562]